MQGCLSHLTCFFLFPERWTGSRKTGEEICSLLQVFNVTNVVFENRLLLYKAFFYHLSNSSRQHPFISSIYLISSYLFILHLGVSMLVCQISTLVRTQVDWQVEVSINSRLAACLLGKAFCIKVLFNNYDYVWLYPCMNLKYIRGFLRISITTAWEIYWRRTLSKLFLQEIHSFQKILFLELIQV